MLQAGLNLIEDVTCGDHTVGKLAESTVGGGEPLIVTVGSTGQHQSQSSSVGADIGQSSALIVLVGQFSDGCEGVMYAVGQGAGCGGDVHDLAGRSLIVNGEENSFPVAGVLLQQQIIILLSGGAVATLTGTLSQHQQIFSFLVGVICDDLGSGGDGADGAAAIGAGGGTVRYLSAAFGTMDKCHIHFPLFVLNIKSYA